MADALRWSGLRSLIRLFAGIVVPIILARLLSPNEFGLIAMAAVFTNISLLITDLGTGDALIQHQKVDRELESSVFWLNIGFASCIAGLLILASKSIAELYGEPIVAQIVQILVFVLLVQSLNLVHVSLLKKSRNFKVITLAETSSQIAGALIAIGLAFNNFGVWSLVYYAIAKAFFYTLVIWILSDWRPWFHFNIAKVKTIMSFSVNFTVVKFLNYVERNADKLIIGTSQGASGLGVYSRAYTFFNQVIKLISGFYNPVFYSVISNEQNDQARFKKILLLSYESLLYIFMPISLLLMMFSNTLVLIVFGPQWLDMGPILAVLGGVCLVKPTNKLNCEVFKAVNEVKLLRRIWVVFSPIFVFGFFIGNEFYGSVGVAISYLFTSSLVSVVTTYFVVKFLEISASEIRDAFFNPVIRGCITFYGTTWLFKSGVFEGFGGYPALLFAMQATVVLVTYFSLQLFIPVKAQQEIVKIVRRRE